MLPNYAKALDDDVRPKGLYPCQEIMKIHQNKKRLAFCKPMFNVDHPGIENGSMDSVNIIDVYENRSTVQVQPDGGKEELTPDFFKRESTTIQNSLSPRGPIL